jgi:hypothetical protein
MHQKRSGPSAGDAEARKIAPDKRSLPTKASDRSPPYFLRALSRPQRSRLDRVLVEFDPYTDRDWSAERPGRNHRVRDISAAEMVCVEVELGERGVPAVLPAKLHRPEEFSDDAAKMLWGQAAGSWPEIYEIGKAFQKLGARSRQAVRP